MSPRRSHQPRDPRYLKEDPELARRIVELIKGRAIMHRPSDPRRLKQEHRASVDQLLEDPEVARILDRFAEQLRAGRQQRKIALTRMFQARSRRYTERDLDNICWIVKHDPSFISYWSKIGHLESMFLSFVLSRLKQMPGRWKPSQAEQADLVDRVAEGTSSRGEARRRVARMIGSNEAAVKKADREMHKRDTK